MNQLEEYQAFVAVVESGSFTAAAKRLQATKSVLSRRVSMLEQRLGVQLLNRTTRSQSLTASGAEFFDDCRRILADLEEAESSLLQQHGTLRGNLRIALPLSFGVRHMCAPLAQFNKLHPELEFELDLSDRVVDLIRQKFDLALRIGELSDSTMVAKRLFNVRMVMCASPAYLHQHGTPQSPHDLQQHRCLGYSQTSMPNPWLYRDASGQSHRFKPTASLVASSGDYLCNAAAHGQGIILLPTFIVAETMRSGKLQSILTDYEWPGVGAYAVYPRTRHLSYKVRALIDFLSEKFAGTTTWDRDCGF